MTAKLKPRSYGIDEADVAKLETEDAQFIGDTSAAVFMGASRSSHLILVATALFFVTALVWAALADIDEVTRGEGKVIPSNKIQVIQNLEGGILTEILVKEGEIVEKDQPLLRLDDTRFSSTYRESRARFLALQAKSARLIAEANNKAIEMPELVLKEDPELAANEIALYESRVNELRSNLDILQQQENQARQELKELQARKLKQTRSYKSAKDKLAMYEPLLNEGAISEVEVLNVEELVNETRGELEASRLAIPRVESILEETSIKLKDLEISFRTQARTELNEAQSELSAIEETLFSQDDRVKRTLVKSPVRGEVKQIMVATIGGVIQPGMDLIEIVPLEGSLLVEAHVRPADIAFLRPEQDAKVKLTAYDYAIYGGLPAKLEHISADTITDEKGESFYLIKVRTDRDYLGSRDGSLRIIPGMTATVDILTGEKSVLDYLLKPVLRAREKALRER
ncbi:MAG: HlyD family type I secretion periplasmic adaptor subunit [Gammaproteobacteria bacterium]